MIENLVVWVAVLHKTRKFHPFMRSTLLPFILTTALSLTVGGCRDREVSSYRVPKEKEAPAPVASATPAAAPATMANTAVPTADGASLSWTAPAHWQAKPATAMRKGSYAVPIDGGPAADLSITAFPGDVGGESANINRWRGQIQLAPASDSDLAAITRFESGGLKIAVVDFESGQQRLLGAIIPFQGSTWFVKLMGPSAELAKEKPAFLAFLKTVKAPSTP